MSLVTSSTPRVNGGFFDSTTQRNSGGTRMSALSPQLNNRIMIETTELLSAIEADAIQLDQKERGITGKDLNAA